MIGLIDCTHVQVQLPADLRSRFYNRKSTTSLNIQVVTDPHMRIINFVNRWPGSVHDSRIFHASELFCRLEHDRPDGHILGDAGYTCYPYLLTPLRTGDLLPPELNYQTSHIATRNLIERFFGAWRSKFQCLKFLRLKLDNVLNVVSACAVVWNFLLAEKDLPEEDDEHDPIDVPASSSLDAGSSGNQRASEGQNKRQMIIDSFFS